jgi:hypothetical protein
MPNAANSESAACRARDGSTTDCRLSFPYLREVIEYLKVISQTDARVMSVA